MIIVPPGVTATTTEHAELLLKVIAVLPLETRIDSNLFLSISKSMFTVVSIICGNLPAFASVNW